MEGKDIGNIFERKKERLMAQHLEVIKPGRLYSHKYNEPGFEKVDISRLWFKRRDGSLVKATDIYVWSIEDLPDDGLHEMGPGTPIKHKRRI